MKEKPKIRVIVSIDGGGIRGLIPLTILDYFDKEGRKNKTSTNVLNQIDFAAGTSTGAIISAGLIAKKNNKHLFTPEHILKIYAEFGPLLFNTSIADSPKGENKLTTILERNFQHLSLNDLSTHFAFVSYDTISQTPFVFGRNLSQLKDVSLGKALSACGAVPKYFPPVKLYGKELVDGIKTAKNPSEIALEQAKTHFPNDVLLLLSFGTGQLKGGYYDAIEKEVDEVDQRLSEKAEKDKNLIYYRFQPDIIQASQDMSDTRLENIKNLQQDALNYIESNKNKLNNLFQEWNS